MDFIRRLCLILAIIAIFFVVTGCAPSANVPPFLALITPIIPGASGQCSGAVVDPTHVVTAAHCVETARRVVTATGQQAWVKGARVSRVHDVAVLTVDRPLFVSHFAEFAQPALNTDTVLYGFCPYQVGFVPRHAFYDGLVEVEVQDGPTRDYGLWILPSIPGLSNKVCGGDSGLALLQHGKIVGILSAVESEFWFVALGSTAYSVPVEYARPLLEDE